MKFEMIEKGFEYATAGYRIKKSYRRVAKTHCGFSTLDRYGWEQEWNVYPENERIIYSFHTLKEAKAFIENKEA